MRNTTIAQLYKFAIFRNDAGKVINTSGIQIEIPDSALYVHVLGVYPSGRRISSGLESLSWIKLNGYCYESKVPPVMAKERFNIMLQDLNRYFGAKLGIFGGIEKRNEKYLALIRTDDKDLLKSKGVKTMHGKDKFFTLKIQNEKIQSLIDQLLLPLQGSPPVIDETGYTEPVDISLSCTLSNVDELNKALDKYGLKLVLKEKEMDVGVIRMKK
jgi:hypothetical protein